MNWSIDHISNFNFFVSFICNWFINFSIYINSYCVKSFWSCLNWFFFKDWLIYFWNRFFWNISIIIYFESFNILNSRFNWFFNWGRWFYCNSWNIFNFILNNWCYCLIFDWNNELIIWDLDNKWWSNIFNWLEICMIYFWNCI